MKKISRITKKIKEKHQNRRLRRSDSTLSMAFYDSIFIAGKVIWDSVVSGNNIYLSYDYLAGIEEVMGESISFRYVLMFDGKKPVAVGYFQLVNMDAESLGLEKKTSKTRKIQGDLIGQMRIRCMVNGNLFCSGQNGFYYTEDLNGDEAYQALAVAIYRIRRADKLNGTITAILAKDFYPESYPYSDELMRYDYRAFCIDPNMVLDLDSEWNSMSDYLAAMTSKYRSQYKNVMKKSVAIESRFLSSEEIKRYTDDIQRLFDGVHDKAEFKFGRLDVRSFVESKQALKDSFFLKGYFLEGKMVGFFSAFINGDALDANYVGMDYAYNQEYGIYQTLLYDYVELALEKKLSKINYGRTAGEMKSSVGARPVEMKCYLRHQNSISNKLIKPLFQFIAPAEFAQRDPFKKKG